MFITGIIKGAVIWLYETVLEVVEFIADSLLDVFNMDMDYFMSNIPAARGILTAIAAAGWALLIGNLVFQALKSMMSGAGFEGEDPKLLFCRTFVFSFLLAASRHICQIGLDMTSRLNDLFQIPDAVKFPLLPLDLFAIPGSWLLVIIVGVVLILHLGKFFLEMAERYVVLVVLTLFSPLAFGAGGSKNTEEIFRGWCRMYAGSCLMMLFNSIFLKLLLSAMSSMPAGTLELIPWTLFVVGVARVSRRIDDIVARIGLTTARTGDSLSRGSLLPMLALRSLGKLLGGKLSLPNISLGMGGFSFSGGSIPPLFVPHPTGLPGGGRPSLPAPSSGGAGTPPTGPDSGSGPAGPSRPPIGTRGEDGSSSAAGGGGFTRGGGAGRSSGGGFSGTPPYEEYLGRSGEFSGESFSGFGGSRSGSGLQGEFGGRRDTTPSSPQPSGGGSTNAPVFDGGSSRGGGVGRSSSGGFSSSGQFGGRQFGGSGTSEPPQQPPNGQQTQGAPTPPIYGGGSSRGGGAGRSSTEGFRSEGQFGGFGSSGASQPATGEPRRGGGGRSGKNIDIYAEDDPAVQGPTQGGGGTTRGYGADRSSTGGFFNQGRFGGSGGDWGGGSSRGSGAGRSSVQGFGPGFGSDNPQFGGKAGGFGGQSSTPRGGFGGQRSGTSGDSAASRPTRYRRLDTDKKDGKGGDAK